MPEGLIIKALSGYYYVRTEDGENILQCRARGIFKKRGISPLVGDLVVYEATEGGEGMVDDILPRSSELIRPPIANVELAVLVFSVNEPALNLQLLDKFLVHTEDAGIETMICFSKRDLIKASEASADQHIPMGQTMEQITDAYERIGYPVVVTSSKQGVGIEEVKRRLAGKISVFAGQSGVGKSTLLNALIPGLRLETNKISAKLGRGKHTTRHVELIPLVNGGLVADTPGFSQLDFANLEADGLSDRFREFRRHSPHCKFRGCLHRQEPGCKVIEAVGAGKILKSRYEHYISFLQELMERKRRY